MKLINFNILIILLTLSSCANEKVFVRKNIELPPVKLPFSIVPTKSIDYELLITPLIDEESNSLYIPNTIEEAVNQIKLMLSKNDYKLLMKSYFLKPSMQNTSYVEELMRRLSNYLFNNWVMSETILSEKLKCLGAFEGSVSFLFYMESVSYATKQNITLETDSGDDEFWQRVKECEAKK